MNKLTEAKRLIDNLKKDKRKIVIALIKYADPHTSNMDDNLTITSIKNLQPLIDSCCGVIALEDDERLILSCNFFDMKDNLDAGAIISDGDEIRADGLVFRDIHLIIKKNIIYRKDMEFMI